MASVRRMAVGGLISTGAVLIALSCSNDATDQDAGDTDSQVDVHSESASGDAGDASTCLAPTAVCKTNKDCCTFKCEGVCVASPPGGSCKTDTDCVGGFSCLPRSDGVKVCALYALDQACTISIGCTTGNCVNGTCCVTNGTRVADAGDCCSKLTAPGDWAYPYNNGQLDDGGPMCIAAPPGTPCTSSLQCADGCIPLTGTAPVIEGSGQDGGVCNCIFEGSGAEAPPCSTCPTKPGYGATYCCSHQVALVQSNTGLGCSGSNVECYEDFECPAFFDGVGFNRAYCPTKGGGCAQCQAPNGNNSCYSNADCCDLTNSNVYMVNGSQLICVGATNTPGHCCVADGNPQIDAKCIDCCSGYCGSSGNFDAGGKTVTLPTCGGCKPNGVACGSASECCANACTAGKCGTCSPNCAGKECGSEGPNCTGSCGTCPKGTTCGTDSLCHAVTTCTGAGDTCSTTADCCSGLSCQTVGTSHECWWESCAWPCDPRVSICVNGGGCAQQ